MEMKRGLQKREKKHLSAKSLLLDAKLTFAKIPTINRADPRGPKQTIAPADVCMSALAMFSLKSPSLLAFDRTRKNDIVGNNLKKLYYIEHVPCDTYMREVCDEIDPSDVRECFCNIFYAAQRNKLIENYRFLDDSYLLLLDGSEMFSSNKVHCKNCCEKHHRDGTITYYHQVLAGAIVHPGIRQVIPLCPEPINKQDGVDKNDCERRAMQRFLSALKQEHPRLKVTIVADALSANTPQINEIKDYGHHFIINAKPGNNKSLFEFIEGIMLQKVCFKKGKNSYVFRFVNGIPLNDAPNAPLVNFLECTATEIEGKRVIVKIFSWVTDFEITNENVFQIMQGGRARWKVENETFNTLKNQGYQFEHNFGHGKKNLTSVFVLLLMLAFLIDQMQEAACGLFQAARQKMISRRALWERMRSYFYTYFVNSWKDLFTAIANGIGAVLFPQNTS